MSKPNFEKFAYSTPYDAKTIAHAATMTEDGGSRERFYAPTGFGDEIDQRLAVYLTTAEGADLEATPVVRMTAFSDDNGRLEGGYFDAFLSHALKRPVLAANAPGVDFSAWRDPEQDTAHLMTPDQREDLMKRGSFGRSGAAVMRALIASSEHFDLNRSYLLTASSMGVALGGGAVREGIDRGIKFEGITFGEPVNIVKRNLGRLALQFATQLAPANNYLQQNPAEIPGEARNHWMQRVREGWPANYAYIKGLGRASLLPDLGNLADIAENNIPVLLGRGTASTLSPETAFYEVVKAFNDANANTEVETNKDDGHSYTMNVESVVKSARAIAA